MLVEPIIGSYVGARWSADRAISGVTFASEKNCWPTTRSDSDWPKGLNAATMPTLVRAYSDPEIGQWHARTMDAREAQEWIRVRRDRWEAETGGDWAVTEGPDGEVAGRMGFRRLELAAGLGEVAYWVLPAGARARRGSAGAVRLSDWAFHRLGLHRLELLHATGNFGSCRSPSARGLRSRARCASWSCTLTVGTTCTCTPGSRVIRGRICAAPPNRV